MAWLADRRTGAQRVCPTQEASPSTPSLGERPTSPRVDRSDKTLTLLERNLALNDLPSERHTSICEEVLPYLKEHGHEYDLIILDPPAFAKHVQHRHKAIIAYKHLNKHALRTVRRGGIVITLS